jgi:hypothetical protein
VFYRGRDGHYWSPPTRAKPAVLDLQRPGLCETRTVRWREMDSNFRFRAPAASARAAAVISESIGIPPHLSLPPFETRR